MEEFTSHGVKRIITNCPEGYHTFKVDYPRLLGHTGIEVVHMTEVIAPLVQSGELNPGTINGTATYHDPCALGRCSRIFDGPRQIIDAVDGLELVEMEQNREKALCCGASPWVYCGAVNREIQEELGTVLRRVPAEWWISLRCERIRQRKGSACLGHVWAFGSRSRLYPASAGGGPGKAQRPSRNVPSGYAAVRLMAS